MSDELTSLQTLASDYRSLIVRLSPTSQAVLFYATKFWSEKGNWYSSNPLDTISDVDWDIISAYVDGLLYEVKNPLIGMIIPFITQDPPTNVLPCDGSTYLKDDFPILYDVIDPAFIVDATHFKVPDLRGLTVIGAGGSFSVADTGGEETHTLDVTEIPSHDHTIPLTATTLAVEPGEVTVLTPVPFFTTTTGLTGGSGAHNNMQPYLALNYGVIAS